MSEKQEDEIAAMFSGNFARLNADGTREIIPIKEMMKPAITEDIRRTDAHEYLFGYEVYAYAYWEDGQYQDRQDARFASHWSTPTGQFTRLFAEMQLRDAVLAEREKYAEVRKVLEWYGNMIATAASSTKSGEAAYDAMMMDAGAKARDCLLRFRDTAHPDTLAHEAKPRRSAEVENHPLTPQIDRMVKTLKGEA